MCTFMIFDLVHTKSLLLILLYSTYNLDLEEEYSYVYGQLDALGHFNLEKLVLCMHNFVWLIKFTDKDCPLMTFPSST